MPFISQLAVLQKIQPEIPLVPQSDDAVSRGALQRTGCRTDRRVARWRSMNGPQMCANALPPSLDVDIAERPTSEFVTRTGNFLRFVSHVLHCLFSCSSSPLATESELIAAPHIHACTNRLFCYVLYGERARRHRCALCGPSRIFRIKFASCGPLCLSRLSSAPPPPPPAVCLCVVTFPCSDSRVVCTCFYSRSSISANEFSSLRC